MISGLNTGCGFICMFFSSESLVLLSDRCSSCEGMGRREAEPRPVDTASYNCYVQVSIASETGICVWVYPSHNQGFQFYWQS